MNYPLMAVEVGVNEQSCDCKPCDNTVTAHLAVVKDGGTYCSEDCANGRASVDHQDKLECCNK